MDQVGDDEIKNREDLENKIYEVYLLFESAMTTVAKDELRKTLGTLEPTDEELEELLAEAADILSTAWAEILQNHILAHGNTLNLAEFNEYLLPINYDPELVKVLLACCREIPIGDETVREVLRRISMSLPAGQTLPEAMIACFKTINITVK